MTAVPSSSYGPPGYAKDNVESSSSSSDVARKDIERDNDEDYRKTAAPVSTGVARQQQRTKKETSMLPRQKGLLRVTRQRQQRQSAVIQAFWRSLLRVDHTRIAFVPPMRTALIITVEMCLVGIGNHRSTAFRLGALFVGLCDPSGSLGRRLRDMGLTLLAVVLLGALAPALTWRSSAATAVAAFLVALLTGLSPTLNSAGLFSAMKFGMALFAINSGVCRSTNGYGGLGYCTFWTFVGAICSLALALLPEIIGNRDAVRTDLFQTWRGFGMDLRRWGKNWGTATHWNAQPRPTVTLSVTATKDIISLDETEQAAARAWLLRIMESADAIRVACLCLTNPRRIMTFLANDDDDDSSTDDKETDAFLHAVGRALCRVAFAIQFPWIVRYTPFLRKRTDRAMDVVNKSAAALINVDDECENSSRWLSSIVELIRSEVQLVSELVGDCKTWPPYSPPTSLPRRIRSSLPSTLKLNEDPSWATRGYALRLATTFTLAMIPLLVFGTGSHSAHWFPMTVAFIMVPSQATTYEKVAHRVMGTLFGVGLGAALAPLFDHAPALIVLLGLTTYAAVLFVSANYALFTFFVTGWVYVTVVGAGSLTLWSTTLYRCGWTLAAGALVMIAMLPKRPKANIDLESKIAKFAEGILSFAQAVIEQRQLRHRCLEEQDADNAELIAAAEAAKTKTNDIRGSLVRLRTAMLADINEAALSPGESFSIDPHSLAPKLAADLLNAVVILQSVYLISDGSADDLLSDIDEVTFSEMRRLVKRLKSGVQLTSTTTPSAAKFAVTRDGMGPFSNAIACAHRRLDEAHVETMQ